MGRMAGVALGVLGHRERSGPGFPAGGTLGRLFGAGVSAELGMVNKHSLELL